MPRTTPAPVLPRPDTSLVRRARKIDRVLAETYPDAELFLGGRIAELRGQRPVHACCRQRLRDRARIEGPFCNPGGMLEDAAETADKVLPCHRSTPVTGL